jgi:hypothetical protein
VPHCDLDIRPKLIGLIVAGRSDRLILRSQFAPARVIDTWGPKQVEALTEFQIPSILRVGVLDASKTKSGFRRVRAFSDEFPVLGFVSAFQM